jgi:hypothetical protein
VVEWTNENPPSKQCALLRKGNKKADPLAGEVVSCATGVAAACAPVELKILLYQVSDLKERKTVVINIGQILTT